MNPALQAYHIEVQRGKIALLEKSLSVLSQAAQDEQVFTHQEDISEHYAFAIGKLTRALNMARIRLEHFQNINGAK